MNLENERLKVSKKTGFEIRLNYDEKFRNIHRPRINEIMDEDPEYYSSKKFWIEFYSEFYIVSNFVLNEPIFEEIVIQLLNDDLFNELTEDVIIIDISNRLKINQMSAFIRYYKYINWDRYFCVFNDDKSKPSSFLSDMFSPIFTDKFSLFETLDNGKLRQIVYEEIFLKYNVNVQGRMVSILFYSNNTVVDKDSINLFIRYEMKYYKRDINSILIEINKAYNIERYEYCNPDNFINFYVQNTEYDFLKYVDKELLYNNNISKEITDIFNQIRGRGILNYE